MSHRKTIRGRVQEVREVPTKFVPATVNWTVVATIVAALVIGIPGVVFALRLLDAMDQSQLMYVGAVVFVLALVWIVTRCWTSVVIAYSSLRRREDAEDDERELLMLRTAAAMGQGSMAPTYNMQPGGVDQTMLAQLLSQQAGGQMLPDNVAVVQYEDDVEFG